MSNSYFLPSPQSNDLFDDTILNTINNKKDTETNILVNPNNCKKKRKKKKKLQYRPRKIIIRGSIYEFENPSDLTPRQQVLWHKKKSEDAAKLQNAQYLSNKIEQKNGTKIFHKKDNKKIVLEINRCPNESNTEIPIFTKFEKERKLVKFEQVNIAISESEEQDIEMNDNGMNKNIDNGINKFVVNEEHNFDNVNLNYEKNDRTKDCLHKRIKKQKETISPKYIETYDRDNFLKYGRSEYIKQFLIHDCYIRDFIVMELKKFNNVLLFNNLSLEHSFHFLMSIKDKKCCIN